MKHFKPYLYLQKKPKTENEFELSIVVSLREGFRLKNIPEVEPGKDNAREKKHKVVLRIVEDKRNTASVIHTTLPVKRDDNQVKVDVIVKLPKKENNPAGRSTAHYSDPDKKFKRRKS